MNAMVQKEKGAVARPVEERERFLTPEVDIFETKDEYVLEAEMPGVGKDGLELMLEGHVLTIVGHRNHDELHNATSVYRESDYCSYRRVFELDPAIDAGKINARMEQGVLKVRLPKAERVKPRKITVGE